jgi:hypothetical protein
VLDIWGFREVDCPIWTKIERFPCISYFNARLFALRVYIINGVTSGGNIKTYAAQVRELGQDFFGSRWLPESQFSAPYAALLVKLDAVILNYKPGSSVANLQRNYLSSAEHLQAAGEKADTYRLSDPDEYNSLVPIYNAELKSTKRLANRLAFQSTAADDLDLAFNRCMDPAILMSKFDKVGLTETNQSGPPDVSVPPNRPFGFLNYGEQCCRWLITSALPAAFASALAIVAQSLSIA